jgi:hypothetical protein
MRIFRRRSLFSYVPFQGRRVRTILQSEQQKSSNRFDRSLSLSLSLSTLKLRLLAALMVSVWMKEQSIKRTTRISKARVFFAENYGSTGLTVVFNSFFVTGYLYKFDLFD